MGPILGPSVIHRDTVPAMSPDALTIIGTGIALAALNVGLTARLRTDVRADVADLKRGQTRLEDRLVAVEREQARTSGLLEGLGLTGRAEPAASD